MQIRDINLGHRNTSRSPICEGVIDGVMDLMTDIPTMTDKAKIQSINEAFEYARRTVLIDESEAHRIPGTYGKAYYRWTSGRPGQETIFLCEVFHRGVEGSLYLLEVAFGVAKDKRGLVMDVYKEDIPGVNPMDTLSTVVSCVMSEIYEHIPPRVQAKCDEIAIQYSPVRGSKEQDVDTPEQTKRGKIYTRLVGREIKQNPNLRDNLKNVEKMVVGAQVTIILTFQSKLSEVFGS